MCLGKHRLAFGFSYYGTVLIMPQVLPLGGSNQTSNQTYTGMGTGLDFDGLSTAAGQVEDEFNYPALFVSSTAEVVGCTIGESAMLFR